MSSKLREALKQIRSTIKAYCDGQAPTQRAVTSIFGVADYALSEPLRNCDVGSLDEQIDRFNAFCENHTCSSYLGRCPLVDSRSCRLAWAQMPYEEVKG